jgi:uncharacterized membrane protein
LIITRVIRIGRSTVGQDEDNRPDVMMSQFEHKTRKIFDFFMRVGISLVVIGIILTILSLALFKWAVQSYMWSAVIIVVGAITFYLFRRARENW